MPASLILSLVGPDRAGLVEAVSSAVSKCGGNWLESRLARLGGQFAGVVRIEVPEQARTSLEAALAGLASIGLAVTLSDAFGARADGHLPGVHAKLELVGQDRPGIVSQVTSILLRCGANVEDFSSVVESAAMAGGLIFRCEALVTVPDEASLAAIRNGLERLAADLMVDVSVSRN
jgi:glycine cleavage system regulatory protein